MRISGSSARGVRLQSLGAFLAFVAVGLAGESASAQAEYVSVPTRVDILHDEARDLLYISTSTGSVLRYQLSSKTFLTPISIPSSSLGGIDLSPDGNTLAVASFDVTSLHLVDLEIDQAGWAPRIGYEVS